MWPVGVTSSHGYWSFSPLLQLNPGLAGEDPKKAQEVLDTTQGVLVAMPLRFLEQENLLPDFGTAEALAPDTLVT